VARRCVIAKFRERGGHSPRWAAEPEKTKNKNKIVVIIRTVFFRIFSQYRPTLMQQGMSAGNIWNQNSNTAIHHSKGVIEGEESLCYQGKNMIDGRRC
jgi:hypothetical protein